MILALIASAQPVFAGPPTAMVRITSTAGSHTVDLAWPGGTLDWSTVTISRTNRYAGLYFEPLSGNRFSASGAVLIDAMATSGARSPAVPLAPEEVGTGAHGNGLRRGYLAMLPPGRYRLHVLAEVPTTFSLKAVGLTSARSWTARAVGRDRVVYRRLPLSGTNAYPNATAQAVSLPDVDGRETLTLVGGTIRTHGTAQRLPASVDACRAPSATPGSQLCAEDDADARTTYDTASRRYYVVDPVPVALPGDADSALSSVAYYQKPLRDAVVGVSAVSGDPVTDVTAWAVVLRLG